jgi:phosphate transport system permease protein
VRTRNAAKVPHGFDVFVCLSAAIVAGALLWLLGDVLFRGLGAFRGTVADDGGASFDIVGYLQRWWAFLTSEPVRSGREGGIAPILVSTASILGVCLAAVLPLGLGTAMFLTEFVPGGGRIERWLRGSLDVLAGVPSIVFGLFGNALFCRLLGLRFSILSGGLTLACMALPSVIRATEEGFRSVPVTQRLAAAALGFSRTATLFRVVLPQAVGSVVAGLVLGIGRALAETAALIFTSGYVDRMPTSPFDSGRALSVHIYDLAMNVPGGNANAYASALVLVFALVIINRIAARLTHRVLSGGRGATA